MVRLEKAPNGCWAPGEVIIPPSGGNGARQKPTPASEPDNSNVQLFLFLKRGIWNIRHFHIWPGRWFLPLGWDGNRSACLCPDDRITPNTMQCTCMVGSQQDAMAMCYQALPDDMITSPLRDVIYITNDILKLFLPCMFFLQTKQSQKRLRCITECADALE